MPESYVEPVALLNVELSVWHLAGSPSSGAAPLLPGHQPIAWAAVVAGWTAVGLGYFASLASEVPSPGDPPIHWTQLLALGLGTGWIWAALTPVTLRITRNADLASVDRLRGILIYAAAGLLFFVASGVLEWLLAIAVGTGTWREFWTTLTTECVETRLLAFLAIVALSRSAQYFALYRTRHLHATDLETRLARTHLQVLKMQLQPHFLFNTLNAIAELVHTDPEAADQMITRLGRLLRLSLDHASHQVVPLRQEADFLRVYVEIEQVRFLDRLEVVWDIEPDTLDAAVPTLLWQPVLENAIRHGVTPLAGRGRIVISSRREGEDLVLEIRDNGQGLPPGGVPREGVGLRNIRERLDQLYGPRARFTLTPALGGGAVALLRLPFIHCEVPHTPVPLPRKDVEELIP